MTYKLYTDGGARGNPGPAAVGIILFDEEDKLVWIESCYLGNTTNNYAEYQAILLGLKYCIKHIDKKHTIMCHLDSELIVKQLNGEYKVKNKALLSINNEVKDLVAERHVIFKHVFREFNKFADKLVNISLDAANEKSKTNN